MVPGTWQSFAVLLNELRKEKAHGRMTVGFSNIGLADRLDQLGVIS